VSSENVVSFLLARPEYRKTLELAVKEEEQHANEQHYLGWQWFGVETNPSKLMRLVTEGIARVSFKSNSSTNYMLKERSEVKIALSGLDKEIQRLRERGEVEAKRAAKRTTT
jgi:hypothetical protein